MAIDRFDERMSLYLNSKEREQRDQVLESLDGTISSLRKDSSLDVHDVITSVVSITKAVAADRSVIREILGEVREFTAQLTKELQKAGIVLPPVDILDEKFSIDEEQKKDRERKQVIQRMRSKLGDPNAFIVPLAQDAVEGTDPLTQDIRILRLKRFNYNLHRGGLGNIGDILGHTEDGLLDIPNVGSRVIEHILNKFYQFGIRLKEESPMNPDVSNVSGKI